MNLRPRTVSIAMTVVAATTCGALGSVAGATGASRPDLVGTSTTTAPPTVPGRPTTTTPVRPTTTTVPIRPTTTVPPATTTTSPAATTPTTEAATTTTIPAAPPEVAAPPTAPPSSNPPPETAAVIIDGPAPPGLLAPVIVFVTPACAGANATDGAIVATIANPPENSWLYDDVFPAGIEWELTDGTSTVENGSVSVGANPAEVAVDGLSAGDYQLAVVDAVFPALTDSAPVTVPACGGVDPLAPTLELFGFACPDLNSVQFAVGNPGGDDGTDRNVEITLVDGDGDTQFIGDTIADGMWQTYEFIVDAAGGTYTLTVLDHNLQQLSVSTTIDAPPCTTGPETPAPGPLLAPIIAGVATECATANSGYALVVVIDPNLGSGTAGGSFEYVVTGGNAVVADGLEAATPTKNVPVADLFAGSYEVTVSWELDPTSSATASFAIPPCVIPAEPPDELALSVLWSTCHPAVVSQTLISAWHPVIGPAVSFTWYLYEGQDAIDVGSFEVDGGESTLIGLNALSAGDYELVVFTFDPSDLGGSVTFTVPACDTPVDPVDPVDPGDPVDPVDPVGPSVPVEPADPSDPSVPPASVEPTGDEGIISTLPVTR